MKANWKKILMGGILLSASAVLLTACGGAEKRKLKMKAVQQTKHGDVKLWVDTEYMGVFKKLSPILKKTPILKLT